MLSHNQIDLTRPLVMEFLLARSVPMEHFTKSFRFTQNVALDASQHGADTNFLGSLQNDCSLEKPHLGRNLTMALTLWHASQHFYHF
jgi:hypothetical protein